ncbi:MAG: hypothetical protein QG639_1104 [Patescibacteria group bacterium]|nr:hypothetical protein [Patescibacteria group bacterium]
MQIPNSAVIVSHVYTTVPFDDLFEYLLSKKVTTILKISHPLYYDENSQSLCQLYQKGTLTSTSVIRRATYLPLPVQYLLDCFLTFFWVFKHGTNWEVCVALDNLNALTAIILRSIGKVQKAIYYTIDFTPTRFPNALINNVYHFLDRLAVSYADITWNVSDQIRQGRRKVRKMVGKNYERQITVPIGVWLTKPNNTKSKRKKYSLVYAGGLSPHQGIQLVISTLPLLKKDFPELTLTIIGKGSYEIELRELAKKLDVENMIKWLGYYDNHHSVIKELQKHQIALALYNPKLSLWSQYADPSKIKSYLACGLPVITTTVTYMASVLEKNDAGIVVRYQTADVILAIKKLLNNKQLYDKYSKSTLQLIKTYDWNAVFDQAFKLS